MAFRYGATELMLSNQHAIMSALSELLTTNGGMKAGFVRTQLTSQISKTLLDLDERSRNRRWQ